MKKLFYCVAALATVFFAGSCQRENLEPKAETAQVEFTVEAPAVLQTKTVGDGMNVNELVYEVWLTPTLGVLDEKAQKLYGSTKTLANEGGKNMAKFQLDLVNDQNFTILFWAQVNTPEYPAAYLTGDLTAVKYANSDALNANDENLAAFYAVAYVADTKHVDEDGNPTSGTVNLRRPFAQVNLGTTYVSEGYTMQVVNSSVSLDVNTQFDVWGGEASEPATITFDMHAVPSDPTQLPVNGTPYAYAGMNYVFAGDNTEVEYDIEVQLYNNGTPVGELVKVNNIVSSVPVVENHRTNIIGNLLTSKTDYEIIVDARFDAVEEVVYVWPVQIWLAAPYFAAIAQPVERILGKDEVASSNLASSSKDSPKFRLRRFLFLS